MLPIRCDALSFSYPDFIVGPIDFTFKSGITGVIGSNGAGKTTLLAAIAGMLPNSSGSVFINNAPCSEKTRRSRIAFASMRDVLYGKVSFRQHLRFFRLFYPAWSVDIEEELIKKFALPQDKATESASSGMRAKFWLVVALARQADAILFDEPWNLLDPSARLELSAELKHTAARYNIPIIVSSHELEELEDVADSFIALRGGKIVEDALLPDSRESLRRSDSLLRRAYLGAKS